MVGRVWKREEREEAIGTKKGGGGRGEVMGGAEEREIV